MATSGSTEVCVSRSGYTNDYLVLSWKRNSYDTANATNNITVELKIYSNADYPAWNLNSNTTRLRVGGNTDSYNKVNDTNSSLDFRSTSKASPKTIATWTGNVQADSAGNCSVPLYGYIFYNDSNSSHMAYGGHDISLTAVIDQIPRKSKPTCPSTGSFGSTIKITTNRAATSFTHTLVFSCNGHSYTQQNVGADYTFSIPASWAPTANANSQTLTVTCTTYSGSTSLGSESCTSTISVPTSWIPSVSISKTLTNGADNGECLTSVTTVKVSASASGSNGSTISSYTWSGDASGTSSSYSHTPASNKEYTYTVTVKDSRGRTNTATLKVTSVSPLSTWSKNKTSMNFGDSITVSISRKKSTFTHSITYKVGSTTVSSSSSIATSDTKTIAESYASAIPNSSSGTLTITVTTYNGNTSLGSSSQTVTINVASTDQPSIESITAAGVNQFNSMYLKGVSKVKLTVNGAKGSEGASIKSYKITGQNLNYSGTSSSATSETLSSAGTFTYTATVTDSRGRTAAATTSITVTNYTFPTVTMTGHRCNQDGTANDFGEYSQMFITGTYSNVTGNTWSITLKYRKYGSSDDYTTIQSITNKTGTISVDSYTFATDVDTAYEIVATITDAARQSASYSVNISTGRVLMDHYKDRLNTFHRTASESLLSDLGNPDIASVFAGETWFEGALKGRTAGKNSRSVFILPALSYSALGTSTGVANFMPALIKWICTYYQNTDQGVWIGKVGPGSQDVVIINVYNTATVDSNGYPQYASVFGTVYNGVIYTCGYNNYAWYYKTYIDDTAAITSTELEAILV